MAVAATLCAAAEMVTAPQRPAQAQFRADFGDSGSGTGTLRVANRNEALRRFELNLRPGGAFELRVDGNETHRVSGDYTGDPTSAVNLNVRTALGNNRASGDGRITFRGPANRRSVERITLSGRTGNRPFSLNFSPGGSGGGSEFFDSFEDSRTGSGSYNPPSGATQRLSRAAVDLQRNGRAVIRFTGNTTYTLNGTWTATSEDAARVTISSGLGNNTSGSGTVTLTRRLLGGRQLERIDINGRAGNRPYRVAFTAGGGGPDGGGSGGSAVGSLRQTRDGRGTLEIRDRREERLRRVSVDLQRGGYAVITIIGDEPHTMTGRWSGNARSRVDVELSSIFGDKDDSSGRAQVTIRVAGGQPRVETVTGQGRWRGRRFNFDFDATGRPVGGGGNQPGGFLGMVSTREGRGNLSVGSRRDEFLNEARVELKRNGDAIIRLSSRDASFTFEGQWWARGNTIDLDIDRYGSDAARGRGQLQLPSSPLGNLGGRTFTRLQLSGTVGSDRFEADFRVN